MVEKSLYQLFGYDLTSNKSTHPINGNNYYSETKEIRSVLETFHSRERNFKFDNNIQQQLKKAFNNIFKQIVEPCLEISRNLGNIYTGSLYSLLLATILNKKNDLLVN